MSNSPSTHRVPGHDVEVQFRPISYGSAGTKYGVRVLEVRDRPVKDDWRQIGSEVLYADEAEARAAANTRWTEIRTSDWRKSA